MYGVIRWIECLSKIYVNRARYSFKGTEVSDATTRNLIRDNLHICSTWGTSRDDGLAHHRERNNFLQMHFKPMRPCWPGAARLEGLPGCSPSLKNVRQKLPPNGQTRLKFGSSCEISQHNHFRYVRHHFVSTFPRNPTKPMFRSFPTTPLMRWRFQHTCRWIWRFRGCNTVVLDRNVPSLVCEWSWVRLSSLQLWWH